MSAKQRLLQLLSQLQPDIARIGGDVQLSTLHRFLLGQVLGAARGMAEQLTEEQSVQLMRAFVAVAARAGHQVLGDVDQVLEAVHGGLATPAPDPPALPPAEPPHE